MTPLWSLGVLLALGLGLWFLARSRNPFARSPESAPAPEVLSESLSVANVRRDAEDAMHWAQQLARVAPHDSPAILQLGLAYHNLATMAPIRFGRPRSASRTSLQAISSDIRAMELLDSAATLASSREQRLAAVEWYGKVLEVLGLPVDAMQVYLSARNDGALPVTLNDRAYWVLQHLRDPQRVDARDTSAVEPRRSER